MTIYRWKPGKERVGGDVQRIGEQLQTLVSQHGDTLPPEVVVDAARPESSPLHGLFEWNDVVAADRYREEQARVVLRSIEVIPEKAAAPRRMFVAVVADQEVSSTRTYTTTARLAPDLILTLQILEAAMDNLETFREKYGKYAELSLVADHAQGEIHSLMRKQQVLSRIRPTASKAVPVSCVDNAVPKVNGSQMQELLMEFDSCYRERMGFAAPLVRGKDHKLAQQMLQRYTLTDLKVWVRRFFDSKDQFIRSSGYTFGVFSACLGKVIVASTDQREHLRQEGSSWIKQVMDDRERHKA